MYESRVADGLAIGDVAQAFNIGVTTLYRYVNLHTAKEVLEDDGNST